ncbi:hypothetical protein BOTBODRAFT_33911 [Botryobasidium botryosum FD-172 SS1]|uniref:Uncharacterized protein n=1 Tax=Botryobasidium botryosum (strain FD-172 SS1) TaxID=930990 RepID=A0A067MMB4_BOTB1|nr:hypothetical protein BOTBODRAFT_33911 [Botryobasidium botryosum FD-172 SS1]
MLRIGYIAIQDDFYALLGTLYVGWILTDNDADKHRKRDIMHHVLAVMKLSSLRPSDFLDLSTRRSQNADLPRCDFVSLGLHHAFLDLSASIGSFE